MLGVLAIVVACRARVLAGIFTPEGVKDEDVLLDRNAWGHGTVDTEEIDGRLRVGNDTGEHDIRLLLDFGIV